MHRTGLRAIPSPTPHPNASPPPPKPNEPYALGKRNAIETRQRGFSTAPDEFGEWKDGYVHGYVEDREPRAGRARGVLRVAFGSSAKPSFPA